jgi:acetyl esterase
MEVNPMPIPASILDSMKNAPHLYQIGVDAVRQVFIQQANVLPPVPFEGKIEERVVKTALRETPIRVYSPSVSGTYPVVIYMHGGGMVFGDLGFMDGACRYLSDKASCTVISIEYGLSPENKFPKSLEECYEIIKWISQNAADLDIDNARIAVAGDSAGGNLSTAVCMLARQRKEFTIIHQVLLYPWIDLVTDPETKVNPNNNVPLDAGDFSWCADLYLNNPEEAKNPLVSPLFAQDLKGLPAATIITEELDPLEADGIEYGRRLAEAGVAVSHKRFENMIHGFIQFVNIAEEANQALDFVSLQLGKAFNSR